jgi:hypothetical protein
MTLAAREHRAAIVEIEMSGFQKLHADQPNMALPADDLLSERRSRTFAHPEQVVDDQELTLADKRSLLASWASDALGVEDSPSLRQLPSGAVVRVDDIMAALKSLDVHEPHHEASRTFSQSFARRRSKPAARRRNVRPEDDDDPPPSAASARLPLGWKMLTGVRRNSTNRYLDITNGPPAPTTALSQQISVGGRSAA